MCYQYNNFEKFEELFLRSYEIVKITKIKVYD